jgi:hypothetical protein
MRHFASIVALTALAALGCDQRVPTEIVAIAGPGPAPSRPGGGQNSFVLEVTPSTAQIVAGGTVQLQTNADAALRSQLQWISSQPRIAPVTNEGLVTGRLPGVATIVVRLAFDTTRFASATITVVGLPVPP